MGGGATSLMVSGRPAWRRPPGRRRAAGVMSYIVAVPRGGWGASPGSPAVRSECVAAEAVCEILHKALPRKRTYPPPPNGASAKVEDDHAASEVLTGYRDQLTMGARALVLAEQEEHLWKLARDHSAR